MIDKLKTYFENHRWFRVICYIITLLILIVYFYTFMIIEYHVSQTMDTIVEVDIYNATHMLWYGAGLGVILFFVDMFQILHCMYKIMMKHKD